MAKDLRGTWKETGVGLGHAFRDLGKTIIKSGASVVKKADNWANGEDSLENTAKAEAREEALSEKKEDKEENKEA